MIVLSIIFGFKIYFPVVSGRLFVLWSYPNVMSSNDEGDLPAVTGQIHTTSTVLRQTQHKHILLS